MVIDPIKNRVVDPGYELFWKEVAQAVDIVSTNAEREIEVSVGDRTATVLIGKKTGRIIIQISDYQSVQPTLIVPPGGGIEDAKDKDE